MDSNNLSSSSLRSFRSSLLVNDPGINGSPTHHSTSHQSIVTAGGTEHELNNNTLRDIEGYTKAFIAALQDYVDYFYQEADPVLGRLPLTLTTHLLSVKIMISHLKYL